MMLELLDDDLLDIDDANLIEDSPLLDSEAINLALLKNGDFSNLTGLDTTDNDMMSPVKDEDHPNLPAGKTTTGGAQEELMASEVASASVAPFETGNVSKEKKEMIDEDEEFFTRNSFDAAENEDSSLL